MSNKHKNIVAFALAYFVLAGLSSLYWGYENVLNLPFYALLKWYIDLSMEANKDITLFLLFWPTLLVNSVFWSFVANGSLIALKNLKR